MGVYTFLLALLFSFVSTTIIENGNVRHVVFPDSKIAKISGDSNIWRSYPPNATEISYKGRWDKRYISWWSAPGLKFGFTGGKVAITFGQYTTPGVLVGYRFDGLDWQFTNISASSTHEFVSPTVQPHGPQQVAVSYSTTTPRTFELRVTNWAYGVQIDTVHLSHKGTLSTIPPYTRKIEIIGDSLSAGQYATYESLSSWSWALCAGLGAEFTISAYPGNCLTDTECWGNTRGQSYQWFRTQDTSWRATQLYGKEPEAWDFAAHPAADLVLVHLGTNDNNTHNNVTNDRFYTSYVDFVAKIHDTWPKAQIILISLNNGFWLDESGHWRQSGAFVDEIQRVYEVYKAQGWIHYFNTTGLLAHNDIGPQWHYTDVGNVKLASHLMQYIRIKFGWEVEIAGPEVLHDTLYWNNEGSY